ncbi:MAG: hypothetical protein K9N11_08835 [Lentisphaeria bacterium]|nr:hypothetical protein [Candidatus Neomarinimicrobiota bacterium]MCF7842942.1 hypothetical protein [Lentisphaeria bacterium]
MKTQQPFNQRSIIFIGVFGTLWGLSEATLGNVLHLLSVPLSGSILSGIGLIIILIARVYNPVRGSTAMMALIAAFIKIMSFATVKLGPFAGILMEGIIVEVILSLFTQGRFAFYLAGLIVGIYPILQNLVTKTILFGLSFVPVLLDMVAGISERFGYALGWWLVGGYVAIHLIIGLLAAELAWRLNRRVKIHLEQRDHV